MNKQSSQKIIVAGSMAAVLAIGVVAFALQHHAPVAVAPIVTVPAPIADTPAPAPSPAAAVAANPAPVVTAAESPVAAARRESAAARITAAATPVDAAPMVAVERQTARARNNTGTIDDSFNHGQLVAAAKQPSDTATRAIVPAVVPAVVPVTTTAGEALPVMPATAAPMPAAAAGSPATDGQEAAKSVAAPATDSWITNEVKSQIAADSIGNDANLGVTTTLGVVMLTGSLASQDAVDHVKDLASRVKDVRSVNVSALTVAST